MTEGAVGHAEQADGPSTLDAWSWIARARAAARRAVEPAGPAPEGDAHESDEGAEGRPG